MVELGTQPSVLCFDGVGDGSLGEGTRSSPALLDFHANRPLMVERRPCCLAPSSETDKSVLTEEPLVRETESDGPSAGARRSSRVEGS